MFERAALMYVCIYVKNAMTIEPTKPKIRISAAYLTKLLRPKTTWKVPINTIQHASKHPKKLNKFL